MEVFDKRITLHLVHEMLPSSVLKIECSIRNDAWYGRGAKMNRGPVLQYL